MQFPPWLLTVTTDIMKEKYSVVFLEQENQNKVSSRRMWIVFKSFIQRALYFAKFMFDVSLSFKYCANVLSFSFCKAYNRQIVSEQLRSLIDSFHLRMNAFQLNGQKLYNSTGIIVRAVSDTLRLNVCCLKTPYRPI